ncbi:MAG: hypothetical protein LQ352_004494 [Teloschistes flavicans]|nr:MAG: hypothetical protein LQ352_004494 [Teloschistes flavicans]
MRSPACTAIGVLLPLAARSSCPRHIGHVPTIFRKPFYSNPRLLQKDDPPEVPEAARSPLADLPSGSPGSPSDASPSEDSGGPGNPPEKPTKPVDKANYGSASRRAGRNLKKSPDFPPPHLSPHFFRANVVLREALQQALAGVQKRGTVDPSRAIESSKDGYSDVRTLSASTTLSIRGRRAVQASKQQMHRGEIAARVDANVMKEIDSTIRAGLRPSTLALTQSLMTKSPHVVLHCPKVGGIDVLDVVVENVAARNNADLIRITANDIAAIGGKYLDEPGDNHNEALSLLAYEVYAALDPDSGQDHPDEEDPEESDEDEHDDPRTSSPFPAAQGFVIQLDAKSLSPIADMFKNKRAAGIPPQQLSDHLRSIMGAPVKDSTRELKLPVLLDTFLNASDAKRAMENSKKGSDLAKFDQPAVSAGPESHDLSGTSTPIDSISSVTDGSLPNNGHNKISHTLGQDSSHSTSAGSSALIIQINDYPEICSTHSGSKLIDALHDALNERRQEGQRVILVGTCASEDHRLASLQPGGRSRKWTMDMGPTRTIMVPAIESTKGSFGRYHRERIVDINMQHLLTMLPRVRLPDEDKQSRPNTGSRSSVPDSDPGKFKAQLLEPLYPERARRLVTVVSGLLDEDEDLTLDHLLRAGEIIETSDKAKEAWIKGEQDTETKPSKGKEKEKDRRLPLRLTEHERRLLPGVINAASIRTSFQDVRAPKETIETLKTLTSLSLRRPDAFTYGVLATDQIPGVLLYGPPGTGKTLLAKAVAKESGATVLEVSGADIHDKYVGESEKNIRAIFSLARKLKPCVVFIDEGDALLGSRNDSVNKGTHRSVLNQFLREWDGMKELSTFIMVATNRPFDLDEASLRRLPRRILVDLPTEKDREEILRIHLKDEQLDPDVSFAKLASETPLYSGSDLKNLAVAAALACVREEYDAASRDVSDASEASTTPLADHFNPPDAATAMPSPPPTLETPSIPPLPPPSSQSDDSSVPSTASTSPSAGLVTSASASSTKFTPPGISSQPESSPVTQSSATSTPTSTLPASLADARRKINDWITARTSKPPSPNDSSSHNPRDSPTAQDVRTSAPPVSSTVSRSESSTLESTPLKDTEPHEPETPVVENPITSSPPPTPSSRRIIRTHHFSHALQEITASISEDMASLNAIKKFDAKYGDRKGRKKRLGGGYGFGRIEEGEKRASIRMEG